MAEKKAKSLVVSAPLVVVKTTAGTSGHRYQGDVLGEDVSQESIDHLRELGYVTEQD